MPISTTSDGTGFSEKQKAWRSIEELHGEKIYQRWLDREFPPDASILSPETSRRSFLKLMGASVALAGAAACRQPIEKIVPYVHQPEEIIPGKPLFFATAMSLSGYARGLLVETHEGRPTKIEGNSEHPASLGATDIFAQASILSLYDPNRLGHVLRNGAPGTLADLQSQLIGATAGTSEAGRIRILTQTVGSPTLGAQLNDFVRDDPGTQWHQWEVINRDNVRRGTQLAFDKYLEPQFHFEKADIVVTLGGDLFSESRGSLCQARHFISRRKQVTGGAGMSRLYSVESTPTLAGSMADHRLAISESELEQFAHALLLELVEEKSHPNPWASWISILAADLRLSRSRSVIYPGEFQSPRLHALACAMNSVLGNLGTTVTFIGPVVARAELQLDSLRQLASDMHSGKVDLLLILEGNPVYDAPADLDFETALKKVKHAVHLIREANETSARCEWVIPAAHYLEAWSDARAFDGTASLAQPMINPLHGGKTAHEVLEWLQGGSRSAHEIVRSFWNQRRLSDDFETWWERSLREGIVQGSASKPVHAQMDEARIRQTLAAESESASTAVIPGAVEIIFRPDATVRDGEFTANSWLQELPKPLTQLAWDNPALISPETAKRHNLSNQDVVELSLQGKTMRAPVWILPGQANDCVTLPLGYGREVNGAKLGFDFFSLRSSASLWSVSNAQLRKVGATFPIACTQNHQSMEGRNLSRSLDIAQSDSKEKSEEAGGKPPETKSLYADVAYTANAWGMAIDLTACMGCKACVIACQAENNIPVVGKSEVIRGREMHWLRVDRYFSGDSFNPRISHQPVPCMQCENAPCEVVCPVAATTHSSEGLNEMTYNRCIGTRYCSNNCPYKVRRFNFFHFSDQKTEIRKLMRNPNVTVRTRGVMEKCTYCVQRINTARIEAARQNRPIQDGEITTACQAVCPTQAIVFGNINDRESNVSKLKASTLNYELLAELNTRPRTTYLARLRNPNPGMASLENKSR